jgi:ferredoxin
LISDELMPYATQLGFPQSENLEKVFAILYDSDEKRRVVAALPGTVEDVAGKVDLPDSLVEKLLKGMRRIGAVNQIMRKKNWYRRHPELIHLRDAVVVTPGIESILVTLFDQITRQDMPLIAPVLKKMGVPPVQRVLPIEETVSPDNAVLDIESTRTFIREADRIVVIPCVCRYTAKEMGRSPDCPAPENIDLCMLLNGFGDEVVDRGIGEEISIKKALEYLDLAEDAGLVHLGRNNVNRDMMICNCCACCCTGLYALNVVNYPSYAPSRFRVRLDESACTGCGTCVDRCQFLAIKVGDIAEIELDKCFGCGNCVKTCPGGALILEEVRPEAHIRKT